MSPEPTTLALVILAGYLIGSLPFSYWVVRWTKGIDVRSVGSGNPGATNVMRAAGPGAAGTALALDVLKGVLPVVAAGWIWTGLQVEGWAALGAVSGHVFSVFLRFRGGKGVATAAGALGAVSLPALGVAMALFAILVASTRFVSLGSIVASASFPLSMWFFGGRGWQASLVPVALIAVLVITRHHANIGRLLRGTESRLGSRGAEAVEP